MTEAYMQYCPTKRCVRLRKPPQKPKRLPVSCNIVVSIFFSIIPISPLYNNPYATPISTLYNPNFYPIIIDFGMRAPELLKGFRVHGRR